MRIGEMFLDVAKLVAVVPFRHELCQVDGLPPYSVDSLRRVFFKKKKKLGMNF